MLFQRPKNRVEAFNRPKTFTDYVGARPQRYEGHEAALTYYIKVSVGQYKFTLEKVSELLKYENTQSIDFVKAGASTARSAPWSEQVIHFQMVESLVEE